MTSGFLSGAVTRGLAFRMLLFLSLALLPIGLIAVVQTREIASQTAQTAKLSLHAVTERAAYAERLILQEAFGAADALGAIVRLRYDDAAECSEFLAEYKRGSPLYAMVGFIPLDGRMSCMSDPDMTRLSGLTGIRNDITDTRRRAAPYSSEEAGIEAATIVTTPLFEDDELIGAIALWILPEQFRLIVEPELLATPLAVLAVNADGAMLMTQQTNEGPKGERPKTSIIHLLKGKQSSVFEGVNQNGEPRVYAVLPIIPDIAYAISVWPVDAPLLRIGVTTRLSAILPILMWIASLIVAFWSLNRLAIRHIRKLGRQMRQFALNRTLPRQTLGTGVPTELVEMETSFIGMADSILRDEATLEDGLREKNILLKEVHHRVKNNLQLISSIMNMQIRQAKSADAKQVLQRLQDRILSLATVHKNLYQSDNLVRIEAGVMLKEIVNQLLTIGLPPGSNVAVEQSYEDITLEADDAAPLMLLVSEAITNALKYIGTVEGKQAAISVSLTQKESGRAVLHITNTVGQLPVQEGTGLGNQLINAFSRQLNGSVEVKETDDRYEVTVTFTVPETAREVYDY